MNAPIDAVAALMREVAEKTILPRYQSLADSEIVEKAHDDVVTIADRESEAMLAEGLAKILPEAAIVGEEAAHADDAVMDRRGADLCWIIDPLDGTNNFARGKPPFGMIIALAANGETQAGWLWDPLNERLCHAEIGKGAFIDGTRITARPTGEDKPVAAISTVFLNEEQRHQVQRNVAPHFRLVDIPRCAAEQYPRLVLGQNDVSVFARTLPWDHAAGTLFVNEAGGCCQRLDGSPYLVGDMRRGLLGASSPRLWERATQQLFS